MRRLRLKALAFIMFVAGAASLVMTVLAYGTHLTTPGGSAGSLWFAGSLTAALFLVGIGALVMIPLAGRRRPRRGVPVTPSPVVARPSLPPSGNLSQPTAKDPQSTAIHVAVLMVAIAGLAVVGSQTASLLIARNVLLANLGLLDGPAKDSEKMARQLDGLAGGTAILAREGHPVARKIVEDLRNVGVNLNPPKATP